MDFDPSIPREPDRGSGTSFAQGRFAWRQFLHMDEGIEQDQDLQILRALHQLQKAVLSKQHLR